MPIELVFVIGMAVLLILCLKVKANAFISLPATALVMGFLSGLSGADTIGAITGGFSGTVKSIGIIIIFGIMLGNYLDAAKGTNRMALDAVRLVGQKRAGLAMAITGYLVSIPVFSDAAGLLGIAIGQAILYGAFAALFMTAFGWIFAELYFRNQPESFYSYRENAKEQDAGMDIEDDSDLPGTIASLTPLVIPILLILGKTTCDMVCKEGSALWAVFSFIGDSNIALALGAVLAIVMLGRRLGGGKVLEIMDFSWHRARERAPAAM